MPAPVLATKLFMPPPRPHAVLRSRLIERLNEGFSAGRRLTLVSAPAGFGKTTLTSGWAAGCGRPVAWLSLDEDDSDLARFLTYLVSALQKIEADIGARALAVLQTPRLPPTESILTELLNEIVAVQEDFVLVLDDYHAVDAKPVDDAMAFVLEHLPPRMHLLIATREDPDLPVALLRARGQLAELRAADLRFTPAETAEFLNHAVDVSLSDDDIAALESRTEGWIAGLQLAAISMQGRKDAAGFVASFAGSHRFVLDYLIEEVLERQPGCVRSFLLQTAVLDRLSGPLCDAVTGQGDGRGMLEALERGNLFVVPLDDERRWYRYHRLFADVLRARLLEEQPDQAHALHLRASGWYARNDLPSDAVRHALAAENFERAAELIELAWLAMEEGSETATWLGWFKVLPDELVRARPVLSVGYAFALLGSGEMEAAEARLTDAERWLVPADKENEPAEYPAAGTVAVGEERLRSLRAATAVARAYIAQALGDLPGTVKHARRVLDLLPEGEHHRRGQAAALLGLTYWASGDLEAAGRTFADYTMKLRASGNIMDAISTTFVLADIKMALGRLREAAQTLEQMLQFVAEQGAPMSPDAADLYRQVGELHRERGELEAAAQHLLRSKELGERTTLQDWQRRQCVAQARLKQTQGDLDGALELLGEAERLSIRTPLPDAHPLSAMKARIWIAQGRLQEALGWAREHNLSPEDDLSYLREFEHITFGRALIAKHKKDGKEGSCKKAIRLLKRLLLAAEEGGRMGSVIEILVLQALAHRAKGDSSLALAPLDRALSLAEPEGYVRIFLDEGPEIAELLGRLKARSDGGTNRAKAYADALLTAFQKKEVTHPAPTAKHGAGHRPLAEPLSERERDVLRLLGTELSGPEIARELYVSPNTMRTHTKNIFSKLGVNNRRAAVRRAKELDLL